MSSLAERFLHPDVRPRVIVDCCAILDRQVGQKSGVSGFAIKAAYKTVKAIKRGFVPGVVDALLDDWIAKLSDFEREHAERGVEGPLGDYLVAERGRVAEALISVTDERAQTTKHKTAKKFYLRLRPSALNHVEDAVPELAALLDKYDEVPSEAPLATPSQEAS